MNITSKTLGRIIFALQGDGDAQSATRIKTPSPGHILVELANHGCAGRAQHLGLACIGFPPSPPHICLEIVGFYSPVAIKVSSNFFPKSIASAFCRSLEVNLHHRFCRFFLNLSLHRPS